MGPTEIAGGHNFTTDMQAADVDGDTDLARRRLVPQPHAGRRRMGAGGDPGPAPPTTSKVGDMDGDRRLDVVTRGHDGPTTLLRQADPGSWQAVTDRRRSRRRGHRLRDLDGDGRLDVVLARSESEGRMACRAAARTTSGSPTSAWTATSNVVGADWQGGPVELWEQAGRPAG